MTPKEKAQQLIDAFCKYAFLNDEEVYLLVKDRKILGTMYFKMAKQQSIFLCKEIIEQFDNVNYIIKDMSLPNGKCSFWIEVKNELEKL